MPSSDRRGFLRGLATLPLIGGSVVLIGSPSAAAVPVTDALLRRYVTFVAREHASALRELAEREMPHRFEPGAEPWHPPMWWMPDGDLVTRCLVEGAEPSTRAAVILSAAGVPLV